MSSRTSIAVARALSTQNGQPRVLVLDEPTANLPSHETDLLFELVRRVSARGVAVVFVSHRLDEVLTNCSSVTVLCDGVLSGTHPITGLNEDALVEMMIGRRAAAASRAHSSANATEAEATMEVAGLSAGIALKDLSFEVAAGEIVGIAGITGSGREDVAPALFGGLPRGGTVTVGGTEVTPARPDRAIAVGMGYVPADRRLTAIFPALTVGENVSVGSYVGLTSWGLIRRRSEKSDVRTWLDRLDVRPRATERLIATLSGGNQQKVVLARWLRRRPRLLILDEPTQGVDVGAKAEIHTMIERAAEDGVAVVVVSTESEELARVCSRVIVIRNGRRVQELSGAEVTPDHISTATLAATDAGIAAKTAPVSSSASSNGVRHG
jgi:ribose transport system ATP-binding protein